MYFSRSATRSLANGEKFLVKKLSALPVAPLRPVRPMRCAYCSRLLGKS